MIVVFVLLLILSIYIVKNTKEPESIVEFKKRYKTLREHVKTLNVPKDFEPVKHQVVVSGFKRFPWSNEIGYNTNKGAEIGVCVDQDPNSMMHVLIHELAHMTVKEYDHSPRFFKHMNIIKRWAIDCGAYDPINEPVEYCGGVIKD